MLSRAHMLARISDARRSRHSNQSVIRLLGAPRATLLLLLLGGLLVSMTACSGTDPQISPTPDQNPDGTPTATTRPADVDGDQDGYSPDNGDCNDDNAAINPGATESCNEVDDDCDSDLDDGLAHVTFYRDSDGDGYGTDADITTGCKAPKGYVPEPGDCNDSNPAIFPGSRELCNGVDDDCDGTTDDGVKKTWYGDGDGDGYGNAAVTQLACERPADFVDNADDCNDSSSSIHPDAQEVCDGVDQDCDQLQDEGVKRTFYQDQDQDGYGNPGTATDRCVAEVGEVSNNEDCDDTNAAVHPGATEVCNASDDDCDGALNEDIFWYRDSDLDGFGDPTDKVGTCPQPTGYVANAQDCDDSTANIHPGVAEVCNGLDDDCNGIRDDGLPTPYLRYLDEDGDTYGAERIAVCALPPSGVSESRGDCNDASVTVYPGASDAKDDGIDQDCGGTTGADPHIGLNTRSAFNFSQAIEVAKSGQTIWIGPATYTDINIDMRGKNLKLRATQPGQVTMNFNYNDGFIYKTKETQEESLLDGLVLTKGSPSIYVTAYSGMTLRESALTGHTSTAVDVNDHSSIIWQYVTCENNTSGCLYSHYESTSFISNSLVRNNRKNDSSSSGGILNSSGGVIQIEFSRVENNTFNAGNAAIYSNSTDFILSNSLVSGNTGYYRGAVLAYNAEIIQSVIANNHCTNTTPDSIKCGIYAEYNSGSTVFTMKQSIVAYNDGYNLYFSNASKAIITIDYNLFFNKTGSNFNLSEVDDSNLVGIEPAFLEYDSKALPIDFHLSDVSPAIDAGNPINGERDPDGSIPDMGAFGGLPLEDWTWDIDNDGYLEYFWPGGFDARPEGVDGFYDCNDLNSTIGAYCP